MSFFQTFYDENGNAVFDPMTYGDNIRVDTSNKGLKFYDSTGKLLFDAGENEYYTANHELLFSGTSNNFSVSNNSKMTPIDVANYLAEYTGKDYTQNGNRYYGNNKSFDAYIPSTINDSPVVNDSTKLFNYYYETGNVGITKELQESLEGTDTICLSPGDWRKNYSAGSEENVQTGLGIEPDNVVYGGASKGGDHALNAFGDFVMENPEAKNPKCLLVEPTTMALNSNFTDEKKEAIRNSNAEIFVVGRSGPTGGFYNNTKLLYGNEEDANSNMRMISVGLNYQRNMDSGTAHGTSLDVGLSKELGLVGLVNGNPEDFERMIEEYNEYGSICYKYDYDENGNPVRTNYTYIPEFVMRYRGQVIEFSHPQDFLDYHNALQIVLGDGSAASKLESLKLIYKYENMIVNVPDAVTQYMNEFSTAINRIENVTVAAFNDPIGLSIAINSTVSAYNNCMGSFKEAFNKYINLGLDISASYQTVEEELADDASSELGS